MQKKAPIRHAYRDSVNLSSSRWLGIFRISLLALLTPPFVTGKPLNAVVKEVHSERFELVLEVNGEAAPVIATAGPGDIAIARVGKQIRGELVPQGKALRLEKIFPADPESLAKLDVLGRQLISENYRLGRKVFRAVGDRVPRFALWDQDGHLFESESLRGSYYVINFVFTRCTMAEMCPASTQRMIQLSEAIKARGWDDVHLVSITLDPAYDTPGIWTSYAESRGIDTRIHSLLGGPPEIVEALKKQMGILAEEDENLIVKHTMSTALIDPTGKIIYRLPGSMWSPDVFVRQIERAKDK